MCAIAALGVIASVAGSIASYVGQMQQAKAMEQNAATAFTNDTNQLNLRQMQETDAANQKLQQIEIDEAERKSEATVQAAEGNVSGLSVDTIMRDIGARAARNKRNEKLNLEYTIQQLQFEKEGSKATNQGRINSMPRPSPFTLIAGIAQGVAQGFGSSKKKYQLA